MQLFFAPNIENHPVLDENDSKHCIRVLRKRTGDLIRVLDGVGGLFECRIIDDNPKKCKVEVVSKKTDLPPKRRIAIAIAPTKSVERIEWFVEKAVEIGISDIFLFRSEHSERNFQKTERLERIAISALKQSLNTYLPTIHPILNFKDFLFEVGQQSFEQKLIGHLTDDSIAITSLEISDSVCLLIGPEGDFSEQEVTWAMEAGFQTIKLGDTRLRTETAGVVGCTMLNLL